jgi:squalene synthase HpnC
VDVDTVARRARTENFPVASLLFPRRLRPHLRAVYGFARLVDMLGDEVFSPGSPGDSSGRPSERGASAGGAGKARTSSEATSASDVARDRLAALDELEGEVDRCYDGRPEWPVMRALQPTIREFDLPREPFLRLIEANRMDQRVAEYATWADLRFYCKHSADPVGRLVLGLLRLADRNELVAASDDVCTGLQLVNFLQDVPRDFALGRIYLPADDQRLFGVARVDRPSSELRSLLEFEAARARGLLAKGATLQERIGGRVGRAVGLFARGGLAALEALERARWDVFTQRPRPSRVRLALAAVR